MALGNAGQAIAFAHGVLLPLHLLLRLHQQQVGGQAFGFFAGHQQVLGAVNGHAFLERGIELEQLVFIDLGHFGDAGQVHARFERDHFKVGFVGNRIEVDAIGLRAGDDLRHGQ